MLEITVSIYQDNKGRVPFLKWLDLIRDIRSRIKIQQRIRRLEQGNFGKCKALKEGIYELKLDFGPGYRIYYGLEDKRLVILLFAGDKSTQKDDIKKAKEYWKNYKEQKNGRSH